MSPISKEQFENIREASRLNILNAAMKLFAKHGYNNTSISAIAKEANISKGLIYNYFESKDILLEETLDFILKKVIQTFIPAAEIKNPDARLEFLIRTNFEHLKKNPEMWRMFITLSLQLDKESIAYKILWSYWSKLFENAKNIFIEMGKEEPELLSHRYGAMIDGLAMQYIMLGESNFPHFEDTLEFIIKEFCSIKNK